MPEMEVADLPYRICYNAPGYHVIRYGSKMLIYLLQPYKKTSDTVTNKILGFITVLFCRRYGYGQDFSYLEPYDFVRHRMAFPAI